MVSSEDFAPAVRSILRAAADRGDPEAEPISVEARSFPRAIADATAAERVPVIAEVKPTSPTTDGVRADDPVRLARAMVDGGAAAISVLTEPAHFGGSPEALERVREAVDVPVLRKDFILAEHQLDVVAADIVLLIARFVDDLPAMLAAATERGFQVLVEVHTPAELRDAVDAGAEIVGINNRDLATLTVDVGTFGRTVESTAVPDEVLLVAESGIGSTDDVRRMLRAGADAVLIGTAIMDGDVRSNTKRMTGAAT